MLRGWRQGKGCLHILLIGVILLNVAGSAPRRAKAQTASPSPGGHLFLVDGESKRLFVIDLVKALRTGTADGAVLGKYELTDDNGTPVKPRPLGVATNTNGGQTGVWVSFEDGSIRAYVVENGRLTIIPERTGKLPYPAARLSFDGYNGRPALWYLPEKESGTGSTLHVVDARTYEEVATVDLTKPYRRGFNPSDPQGTGSRSPTFDIYDSNGEAEAEKSFLKILGVANIPQTFPIWEREFDNPPRALSPWTDWFSDGGALGQVAVLAGRPDAVLSFGSDRYVFGEEVWTSPSLWGESPWSLGTGCQSNNSRR